MGRFINPFTDYGFKFLFGREVEKELFRLDAVYGVFYMNYVMEKDMPAAILLKGTTAGQKRIVATVSTLEEEVKRQGIETPAIIVVGKVCTLAEKFGWYEELPLAGWKVLVTRPKELVSRTADKLREKGAEVLELPAIRTVPMEDQSRLNQAMDQLETYQ